MVKILDLSNLKEALLHEFKSANRMSDDVVVELIDDGPYAFAEVDDQVYLIHHLGSGALLSNEKCQWVIQFYPRFSNNGISFSDSVIKFPVSKDFVTTLDFLEEKSIGEFITNFTGQEVSLIKEWKKILKEDAVTCPLIRNSDDLIKYRKFLRSTSCVCREKTALIEVEANVCCVDEPHIHCKNCGSIIECQ